MSIAIASDAEPGGVGVATEVLQRRLEELTQSPGSPDNWSGVRAEPRANAPKSLGSLQDIVLDFGGQLLPDAVFLISGYLVRAIVGHLRTQPDSTQRVEITGGGEAFVVTPGMSAEELADVETRFAGWIARQQTAPGTDVHGEGPRGGEDGRG
ncbi:hypothetical protein LHJ74_10935 [Streptomyces sp. N2-109]|uniref:Uncharacterized protein n=1 Tax=Streptomyces gossypii TaxID=2883101 RepID=A0ABT2JSF4_9ACTN|nr:hypothetical protein [Streptomyces gossypii]MCT2590419.1 hypothetical protein [Streptomyces gossypii]